MIKIYGLEYKRFKFPSGELQVQIGSNSYEIPKLYSNIGLSTKFVDVLWEFENNEEIVEMMLLVDALKRASLGINTLDLPYIPFARQDRLNNYGETFSLKVFTEILNGFGAKVVKVQDPHSDVSVALINNIKVEEQHQIFAHHFYWKKDFWLISPDGGALKKIYKLAQKVDCLGVVECGKVRCTKTGKILETKVHHEDFKGKECYIADDICGGGRTFTELAKVLKSKGAGKVALMVTHGFFTDGFGVFDGLIDEIYTRKGQVK